LPMKSSSKKQDAVHLEIYPGICEILRGEKETSLAIVENFLTSCECKLCALDHYCIYDVAYVICPECKTVNRAPIQEGYNDYQWGVGLGVMTSECSTAPRHHHF
jgi:hypothetical protein